MMSPRPGMPRVEHADLSRKNMCILRSITNFYIGRRTPCATEIFRISVGTPKKYFTRPIPVI